MSQTRRTAAKVQNNPAYLTLVTVGLIAFGVIHALVGWICLKLATGSGGGEASNQGALADLAATPGGGILLWVIVVGMAALVVWQLVEAAVGNTQFSGKKRTMKRVSSAGRAVVYAALAATCAKMAIGAGAKSSNQAPQDTTATLMGQPFGQVLVGVVGLVVAGMGVAQIIKGVRRKFVEEDLDAGVAEWAKKLGVAGWIAKGVALTLTGVLIGWAAVTADAKKAAGLDGALKSLLSLPFGPFLLGTMALGFAAFGAYACVWAFNARHETA